MLLQARRFRNQPRQRQIGERPPKLLLLQLPQPLLHTARVRIIFSLRAFKPFGEDRIFSGQPPQLSLPGNMITGMSVKAVTVRRYT